MTAIDPVAALQRQFADAVRDVIVFRGETTVVVAAERIADIVRYARDAQGLEFNFLSDIAWVDYYPEEPRFAVCYHLYSMIYNRRLRLKVYLPGDDPRLPSIYDIFPAADFQERECYDMLGVVFEGHPNLRRILMPDDWEGHPHRKDYPLGYEPVQFSFNYQDINRLKPYAKE
jgi:NADH-quinone oxidoreductase subunit C